MTDTVIPDTATSEADLEAQIGAYADNLMITGLHAMEAMTISLGRTLGLYDRLLEMGEATPAALAGPRPTSMSATRRSGSSSKRRRA